MGSSRAIVIWLRTFLKFYGMYVLLVYSESNTTVPTYSLEQYDRADC